MSGGWRPSVRCQAALGGHYYDMYTHYVSIGVVSVKSRRRREESRRWKAVSRCRCPFTRGVHRRTSRPRRLQETAQRGGHIPGASSIPTASVLTDDGTFKSAAELQELYAEHGVTEEQSVVTYCRVGERSSIAWFVLTELLGFDDVENYDGSWTEWGNTIRAPIATGEAD